MKISILSILLSFLFLNACKQNQTPAVSLESDRVFYENFKSKFVKPRHVEVKLPKSYSAENSEKYPVLYMHDGQNLFDDENAYKTEWRADEISDSLAAVGEMQACIIVGIWNTEKTRFIEYMPQKPVENLSNGGAEAFKKNVGSLPLSDNYLKFLTKELKPFIDSSYRTKSDRANTFIAGSSMGGLISLYGICEYPEVFGGAACFSTHWIIGWDDSHTESAKSQIEWFAKHLPSPETHQIYFDFGTKGFDQYYEPYQQMMDERMLSRGYVKGENWKSLKFPGTDHSERSWTKRLHIPMKMMLGKK